MRIGQIFIDGGDSGVEMYPGIVSRHQKIHVKVVFGENCSRLFCAQCLMFVCGGVSQHKDCVRNIFSVYSRHHRKSVTSQRKS